MMARKRVVLVGLGMLGVGSMVTMLLFGVGAANGSGAPEGAVPEGDPTVNQYAAVFACGPEPSCEIIGGCCEYYRTEISIHNPNTFSVFIQKKAVATPTPENLGTPTARLRLTMTPDSAFHIDCDDITTGLFAGVGCPPPSAGSPAVCRGFVIIEAATASPGGLVPAQLDVTAELYHTIGGCSSGIGTGNDFEFVNPKRVNYACWSNVAPICP
jgi:hypothetical protein